MSLIYFCPEFICCPYYRGVRYSGVSARRELTVPPLNLQKKIAWSQVSPTKYRSHGNRVPGLQPSLDKTCWDTSPKNIYLFPAIPAKLKPSPRWMTVSPFPLSKLFRVTPELYTLVFRPKLHVLIEQGICGGVLPFRFRGDGSLGAKSRRYLEMSQKFCLRL